jgi:hypothetical protein
MELKLSLSLESLITLPIINDEWIEPERLMAMRAFTEQSWVIAGAAG